MMSAMVNSTQMVSRSPCVIGYLSLAVAADRLGRLLQAPEPIALVVCRLRQAFASTSAFFGFI
jgi:hypothetical protein